MTTLQTVFFFKGQTTTALYLIPISQPTGRFGLVVCGRDVAFVTPVLEGPLQGSIQTIFDLQDSDFYGSTSALVPF